FSTKKDQEELIHLISNYSKISLYQHHLTKSLIGSILFDVGELHQHLFCIKKYRKDTLKSFRINLATNS
ncbi:hypothetical protein, partial [Enterococcus faecium]|uniref:hypothetical protein n=1 Tax=Enterococcus faecium TaxID=1352 RepID=UPI001CA3051E